MSLWVSSPVSRAPVNEEADEESFLFCCFPSHVTLFLLGQGKCPNAPEDQAGWLIRVPDNQRNRKEPTRGRFAVLFWMARESKREQRVGGLKEVTREEVAEGGLLTIMTVTYRYQQRSSLSPPSNWRLGRGRRRRLFVVDFFWRWNA